jgi:Tol biopolymer transport system component
VNGNPDVWVLDLARQIWERMTVGVNAEGQPVWSPDGRRLAFFVAQQGNSNFFVKPASIDGPQELVLTTTQIAKLEDWSPDGRTLLCSRPSEKTTTGVQELWLLPLDGDRKPRPFLQTGFRVVNGQFSPDGQWIAYESNDSGRFEIYVQPFPGSGERVQISTTGGAQARWRRDGRELFYIALDGRLTAVSVKSSSDGRRLDVGTATPLFTTHVQTGVVQGGGNKQQYVVAEDGQRFLVSTAAEERTTPISVILNWAPTSSSRWLS